MSENADKSIEGCACAALKGSLKKFFFYKCSSSLERGAQSTLWLAVLLAQPSRDICHQFCAALMTLVVKNSDVFAMFASFSNEQLGL